MADCIIRIENLSKRYVISHQVGRGGDGLRHRMEDMARAPLRWLRSSLKSGGNGHGPADPARTEEFWALKDVSFEINRGDVVGIIGRNGAGKSTLLKILSRIVEPTQGRIVIDGRVASLLEVGTGFHAELTGRENIFLNGAILGMSRVEIKKKFDEIVAFAETEKFLDTPVKRYSSGMYVRLAFAVAAHLEPEILIVDEVLAVGDAQFQKKCLGKMQDVSTKEGRTVLFVSHNMEAVRRLCKSAVLLGNGRMAGQGDVDTILKSYLQVNDGDGADVSERIVCSDPALTIADVRLYGNGMRSNNLAYGDKLGVEIIITARDAIQASVEAVIRDGDKNPLVFLGTGMTLGRDFLLVPGENWVKLEIPGLPLAVGKYFIDIAVCITGVRFLEYRECCRTFTVEISDPARSGNSYIQKDKGCVYFPFTCSSSAETVRREESMHLTQPPS